jgi:hypothetical protein
MCSSQRIFHYVYAIDPIVYSENLPNPQFFEYILAGLGRFSEDPKLWEASLCHQRALSPLDDLTTYSLASNPSACTKFNSRIIMYNSRVNL